MWFLVWFMLASNPAMQEPASVFYAAYQAQLTAPNTQSGLYRVFTGTVGASASVRQSR